MGPADRARGQTGHLDADAELAQWGNTDGAVARSRDGRLDRWIV